MCLLTIFALSSTTGCLLRNNQNSFSDESLDHFIAVASEIEAPQVESDSTPGELGAVAPLTIRNELPTEYWDLSLEETVQTAIANSQVLRDLGGAVIRTPTSISTVYNPALVNTDPRFGVDAALSAFDAQLNINTDFANNDRALNNQLLGGGTRLLQQQLINTHVELLKRSATGGEFAVRNNIGYDANNAPSNLFPHAYNANVEFEARQPLLQGAGSLFNRIAGAEVNGRNRNLARFPGDYNGVLIARINTDVQLADLEMGLRDLVSNVENTYWDLYFAYRDLDAKIAARDAALETWRRVHALFESNRRGGEAEKEAQAREQYFQFQEEVENALTGRLLDGTRTNNGSRGGTFRGIGGVHVVERRLRLLMGIPLADGRLARPTDEPTLARVAFDWPELVTEALCRRTELRRQKWVVKRRELELVASRNFLMPRLDAFGQYRFRGFGNNLIDTNTGGNPRFDNAFQDLTTGDFQEWQLGVEFSMPIGFRQAHAGVRNAELLLSRERAVLKEQERQVIHDLANIVAEMDRAYAVAQTAYNRRLAGKEQLEAVQAAFDADKAPLDQVLSAQRTVADSEQRYHRALVEYALAVKNVHFEKGSLLDHNQVLLAEGPWPGKAYFDAARLEKRRGREKSMSFVMNGTPPISKGPVEQEAALPMNGFEMTTEVVSEEAMPPLASPEEMMLQQPTDAGDDTGEEVHPAEEPETPFRDDPMAPPSEMPATPEAAARLPAGEHSVILGRTADGNEISFTSDVVAPGDEQADLSLPNVSQPEAAAENPPEPAFLSRFRPLRKAREVLKETMSTVIISPDEVPAGESATESSPTVSKPTASPAPLRLSWPLAKVMAEIVPPAEEAAPVHSHAKSSSSAGSYRSVLPARTAAGQQSLDSLGPVRAPSDKPAQLRR
jgi:outer membrane protein TolC